LQRLDEGAAPVITNKVLRSLRWHVRQGETFRTTDARKAGWHFQAALLINPRDVTALCGIADMLSVLGDVYSAIKLLRRTAHIAPFSGLVHFHLGCALLEQNDVIGALSEFQAVTECEGDSRIAAISQSHLDLALRSCGGGLGPEAIARLDVRAWSKEVPVPMSQTRCTICLEEFHEGDNLRVLRCAHVFHATCVDHWLSHSATCPLCMDVQPRYPTAEGM